MIVLTLACLLTVLAPIAGAHLSSQEADCPDDGRVHVHKSCWSAPTNVVWDILKDFLP
jgi:hypothetical protein